MPASRKTRWLVVAGALAFCAASYVPTMNALGYCSAERRFLSEEEVISKVIDEVYKRYPPTGYNFTTTEIRYPIKYRGTKEFLDMNGECCRIVDETKHGYRLQLLHRVRGLAAALVEVRYRVEENPPASSASGGMPPGVTHEYHVVTNCGRPWNGI